VGGSSDRDGVDFGSEEEGGAAKKENERQRVFLLACEFVTGAKSDSLSQIVFQVTSISFFWSHSWEYEEGGNTPN